MPMTDGLGELSDSCTLFMIRAVILGLVPLVATIIAIWKTRWRKWLVVLPVLYMAGVHIYLIVISGSVWFENVAWFWVPFLYRSNHGVPTGLRYTCSALLIGMSIAWAYMAASSMKRHSRIEIPRERR